MVADRFISSSEASHASLGVCKWMKLFCMYCRSRIFSVHSSTQKELRCRIGKLFTVLYHIMVETVHTKGSELANRLSG